MRVLIIEDEPLAARKLVNLIKSIDEEIEILDIIDTVADTITYLSLIHI